MGFCLKVFGKLVMYMRDENLALICVFKTSSSELVTWLVGIFIACVKLSVQGSASRKPVVVTFVCNPRTPEVEAKG